MFAPALSAVSPGIGSVSPKSSDTVLVPSSSLGASGCFSSALGCPPEANSCSSVSSVVSLRMSSN
ncbi:MAG TPA: hypothetical protein EYQ37_05785 [Candidatus Marinimicrobia bacterium]|nr:hypothetical protein [Candidatus Neomarinimicrobiota bacterium]